MNTHSSATIIILMLILVLGLHSNVVGQTTITAPVRLTAYELNTTIGIGGSGTNYIPYDSIGYIGNITVRGGGYYSISNFRTKMVFNLTAIPANSTINSVQLAVGFTCSPQSSTAKIMKLSLPLNFRNPPSPETDDGWRQFTYQGVYYWDIPYSQDTPLPISSALISAVQNAYASGYIALGMMSNNESYLTGGANNTFAKINNPVLVITYSPMVTITLQNSFGSGNITVDGNISKAHNSTIEFHAGTPHTLLSYVQAVGDESYTPDNTWTNVTTGETFYQNPLTITPASDATYRANYIPKVAITLQNSFGSGNITVDDYISKAHNSTIKFDKGSAHKLTSYQQQVGEITYLPDSNTPWTNVTAGVSYSQNPLTITPIIDGTYRANYVATANTTVKNSFNGGYVKVGYSTPRPQYASGTVFPFPVGSGQTLEAFNQAYCYASVENGHG